MGFLNYLGNNLGNFINGAFGVGSSLFSANYNRGLQENSWDFQRSERQAAQQYQSDEWSRQFYLGNAEYNRRLADQRAYDSPKEQLARIRATGYSPDIFGENPQGSAFGTPSIPSVSPIQGNGGAPPPYIASPSLASGFGEMADALSSLSSAALNDSSRHRIDTLLSKEAERMANEIEEQQLKIGISKVQKEIAESTKDYKIAQEYWNFRYYRSLENLTSQQYNSEVENELRLREERFWTMAKRRLTDEQYNNLKLIDDHFEENFQNEQNLKKAETYNQYQSGRNAGQQAGYYAELSDAIGFENIVNADPAVLKAKKDTVIKKLANIESDTTLKDETKEQIKQLKDRLEKENDVFYIKLIYQSILDLLNTSANVVKGAAAVMKLRP